MIEGYFNIKRDNELIAGGGFWCNACLVGKPASELSPDPRYCQFCYEFLLDEAKLLTGKPAWVPRQKPEPKKGDKEKVKVAGVGLLNMSILKSEKTSMDIIQPVTPKGTRGKRGPKQRALPVEMIRQWADDGMGSNSIATRLKTEKNILVSYKTIQRLLQRVLV